MAKTSSAMRRAGNPTVTERSGATAYAGWMNDYAKLRSDILSPIETKLDGSEKQQAYASDIINKAVSRAMKEDSYLTLEDPSFAMRDDVIKTITDRIKAGNISFNDAISTYEQAKEQRAPVLDATKKAISKAFSGVTSAKQVIDKRDGFSQYGKVAQAIRNVRSKFKKIHEAGREFTVDAAAKYIKDAYDKS